MQIILAGCATSACKHNNLKGACLHEEGNKCALTEDYFKPLNKEEYHTSAIKWWEQLNYEEKFFKIVGYLYYYKKDTTMYTPHTISDEILYRVFNFFEGDS